jgi:hypothetical protein
MMCCLFATNEAENQRSPELNKQGIADELDFGSSATQHLARLYEQKLAALAALKGSLLHQAFTGEL